MNDNNLDVNLFHIKLFLGFITTVILILILKELKNVFIPLFMALLLYFLFNGVVKILNSIGVPRFIILIFLLVFIFIILYGFGLLIYTGASSFIEEFPKYSAKITKLIEDLLLKLKIPIKDVNSFLDKIDWKNAINPSQITSVLSSTLGSFTTFVGYLSLVLIYLMFMLAGRDSLRDKITKSFSSIRATQIRKMVDSIEDQVQHYLVIKTFVSILTASISAIILLTARIDFILFSALLIFVLNYIPNFGSIIATLFPILITFLNYGLSIRLLLVAIGLILTQFIIGNIVEPKITGKNLDLSPIIILLSLIFWAWIWGVVGMVLAVPLTSAIKIVLSEIDSLKPIAELISSDKSNK